MLKNPVSIDYLFERYKQNDNIDFLNFLQEVSLYELFGSYINSFKCAGLKYVDPYAKLRMGQKLDLNRIRNGESKYLIRELMHKKYPDIPVPEKVSTRF